LLSGSEGFVSDNGMGRAAACLRPSDPWLSHGAGVDSSILLHLRRGKGHSLQVAHCAKDDDGVSLFIFRRGFDLIAGQFERDHVALRITGRKVQGFPIDRDFPAADPQKAAEIDDSRPSLSVAIDNDIDQTSHVLASGAANVLAENWLGILSIDDDGRGFVLASIRRIFRYRI
jgi:hypothetical protein